MEVKTKEEKDAELDRRIEALRKKNQALVRRYQEIEEDKKKAEQEGIAVTTPRKPRPYDPELEKRRQEEQEKRRIEKENFTITVDLSTRQEKRMVNDRGPPQNPPEDTEGPRVQSPTKRMSGRVGRSPREWGPQERAPREEVSGETPGRRGGRGGRRGRGGETPGGTRGRGGETPGGTRGRGGETPGGTRGRGGETPGGTDRRSKEWEEKRRQNIEKMNQEMEKIAEYERGQRQEGDKPSRHFLDDPRRSGPAPDTDRKEGSRRHVRNWGGLDFENVKTGAELEKEWTSRRPGPKGSVDMTMSMTGRERAEYLRWKKEREQIDEERLARHRNATGQWRREWDAQKSDSMFTEDKAVGAEDTEQSACRDETKRPPKEPTFGDFLSLGRSHGGRGERGRGRNRGPRPSYSMHDNRWEEEKEDERREKEDEPKQPAETEEAKSKPRKGPKAPPPQRDEPAEDDEDQWEDASDGEEEPEEPELHPKEQRTPRPKAHTQEQLSPQVSPEVTKPLSPFCPLDHRPVSDWGEEMEQLSPRISIGGEHPLKLPSADATPQKERDPEEEERSEGRAEERAEGQPGAQSEGRSKGRSEAHSEGRSEKEAKGKSEGKSKGEPGAQADGHPGAQADGHPGAQADGHPGAQADGQPGAQADGQPGAQADGHPGAQADGHPGAQAEGHPGAQAQGQPGAQAQGQPGAQAQGQPEEGSEDESDYESEEGSDYESEEGSDYESEEGSEDEPKEEPRAVPEAVPEGHSAGHTGSGQADDGDTQVDPAASAQD